MSPTAIFPARATRSMAVPMLLSAALLAVPAAQADLIGPSLPQPVSSEAFYSNTSVYSLQGELDPSRGFSYVAPIGGTISMFRFQLSQSTYDTTAVQFAILRPTGTPNQYSKVHTATALTGSAYDAATGVFQTPANSVRVEAGDRIAAYNQYGGYQLGTLVPGTPADKIYTSASKTDPLVFSLWSRPVNAYIAMNAEFTPDGASGSAAPVLSGFKFSPRKFKPGGSGTGATAAKKRAKAGSTIKLTASEAATATITFERKSGKKYKKVGTLSQAVTEGKNNIAFNGKIGSKKMRGRYRATAVAVDEADNSSKSRQANFTVVRR